MTSPTVHEIRRATIQDGAACASIYTPYVDDTVVTFETVPPSTQEIARRIADSLRTHAWLVLEDEGRVTGYAYAHPWKSRAAYRWSCEVSVYLEVGRRRTGAGRALDTQLFERLVQRGYRIAIAGMTLPNEASVGLHRAMGFEDGGINRRIGWKKNAWHDVAWMQRELVTAAADPPAELS